MNLVQMESTLSRNGFMQHKGSGLLREWLNAAYFEVINAARFPFRQAMHQLTLPAGGSIAPLPANYNSTINVTSSYYGNEYGNALGKMSPQELFMFRASSGQGKPTQYTIFADGNTGAQQLHVAPTVASDTLITIFYHRNIPAMVGDAAVPVFPEQYHRIIIEGALSYAYATQDQEQEAKFHREEFDRLLQQMIADLTDESDDLPESIGDARDLRYYRQELRGYGFKLSDSVATGIINDAYNAVWGMYRWRFRNRPPVTVSIGPDGKTITNLPGDYGKPLGLYSKSGVTRRKMNLVQYETLRKNFPDDSVYGTPRIYSLTTSTEGKPQIIIYPMGSPGDEFELLYVAAPNRLVSPTDVPQIPEEHRDVILFGALITAAMRAPAPEGENAADLQASIRAQVRLWRDLYQDRLEAMKADLLIEQLDRPRIVAPSSSGEDFYG